MKKLNFSQLSSDYLIDLRSAEDFAFAHYRGAINIPFNPNLAAWTRCAIPIAAPIILIADQEMAEAAAESLQIAGYSVLGFIPFENQYAKDSLETISVMELISGDKYIIDVRTLHEWNVGHIKDAKHIELSQFAQKIQDIPENKEIAVICGGGNRSSVAASLLKKSGHSKVSNVRGGMSAWKQVADK